MVKRYSYKILIKIITLFLLIGLFIFLIVVNTKKFDQDATVITLESSVQIKEPEKEISHSTAYLNYLKENGIEIKINDISVTPNFNTPGLSVTANGTPLVIYEYFSSKKAKNDAGVVVKRFAELTKINKVPIHYFRKDTILVEYTGDDNSVLEILEKTLGPQFAGE